MNILEEANTLINGDRAKDYGDIKENFKNIAIIANILLRHKGLVLTESDCGAVLIALKIAREGNKPKRDNRVDAAAYIEIYDTLLNHE